MTNRTPIARSIRPAPSIWPERRPPTNRAMAAKPKDAFSSTAGIMRGRHRAGGATADERGDGGEAEGRLLQPGGDHEGAEAGRIRGDDQERHLPRDAHADEAVEELGVGDGGRLVPPDPRFQEIYGEESDQ